MAIAAAGVLHLLYMGDYIAEPVFDTKMRAVAVAEPRHGGARVGLDGRWQRDLQRADGAFGPGGLAELIWITFAALLGLACLHPSMKSTAPSVPVGE